ncbi:MAG: PDZ domain-containing protein [Chitinophagaceae bacterium]
MKRVFINALSVMALAVLTSPSVFAQQSKSKTDKETQNIIITRTGNTDERMVIEVIGDKITINGKDAKDAKDVNVHVNKFKGGQGFGRTFPNGSVWNYNFDNDHMSLFSEDANRAMLGVVTESSDQGVRITSVSSGSAAQKAGIKKGDIITRIGTKKIEDTDDVTAAVRSHKPGDKVAVTVIRDGKEQKLNAELGKWQGVRFDNTIISPSRVMPAVPRVEAMPFEYFGNRPRLGLSIQDTDDGKGVKVLEVDEDSNAAKAGIKEDDVITHVNDTEINSTDEISRIVRENREKPSMTVKVLRNGKTQTIEVKTPRKLKTADL